MRDDTYNGWANRETWACHLWLTNDEAVYNGARIRVREAFDDDRRSIAEKYPERPNEEHEEVAAFAMGKFVREFFDEWISAMRDADECNDVINVLGDVGSLWRVEWTDIAAAFLEED